jgi:GxxExxY protein
MTQINTSKTKPPKDWPQAEYTSAILNAGREVHLAWRDRAYSEENYREALARELRRRGYVVQTQVRRARLFKAEQVGESVIDLIVAGKVIVLVKTSRKISNDHLNLLRTYLTDAHLPVGLVLAFSRQAFNFRRLDARPEMESGD